MQYFDHLVDMDRSTLPPFRGKITKLPNSLDPNTVIANQMKEKYSVCPVCGESRKYSLLKDNEGIGRRGSNAWYGKKKHWWHIWEESHCWQVDLYHCHTCGAEWESEPYPTDIKIDV